MGEGAQRNRWIAAAVCAAAGVVVFQTYGNANHGYIDTASLFWWWGSQWLDAGSETQHGWLILGLSGWLLVRQLRGGEQDPERKGLPGAAGKPDADIALHQNPSRVPLAAMLAGLALHAVGFVAQQARLSILALLLFTWGVLRLGGGRRWGAAAAFPLGFLVFAIPINALDSVGFWLRLWVVETSTRMAHAVGIDVLQNGTQLAAPDGRYVYDVAAACSGIRSLMALAALSLLIGYLNFRSVGRRLVVFLSCLPLVCVGNLARILAIIVAAQVGGKRAGDLAHEVMGFGVFGIVLGGVLGVAALVRRFWPEREATAARPVGAPRSAGRALALGQIVWIAVLVVACAGAEIAVLRGWSRRPAGTQAGVVLTADGRNPVELPAVLSRDWVGWPAAVTAVERNILPPDTGYSRINYVGTREAHAVFLSIVLSGRDRTSIHRPELCLVGQGWTIAGRAERQFEYPGVPTAAFPVTVLAVRRQNPGASAAAAAPQLVVYWFVGADRVVATHWQRVGLDMWNRLVHGRVDRWAYVVMQTDAADGEPAALARLQAVLNATLPAFQTPFPRGTP